MAEQLVYELERSRSALARNARGVRRDLNVTTHLKRAVIRRKLATLAAAAVAGMVVTRLLFRKKKVVQQVAEAAHHAPGGSNSGFWLGVLGLLVTLVKPAVTQLLSRKIADYASGDGKRATAFHPFARH